MAEEKTTLYRLYDASDTLLYVGISGKWFKRMAQHARKQGWWDDVVTVKREVLPSRAEALAAELQAIRAEKPLHNVVGVVRVPPPPKKLPSPRKPRPARSPRPLRPVEAARDERVAQLRAAGKLNREIEEELGLLPHQMGESVKRLLASGRTQRRPPGNAALPPERRRRGNMKLWREEQRRKFRGIA